jgi:hypothetical protein
MAFQLLSPGVQISEIDLSTVVASLATTGGVIAGPLPWGPANVKTLVDSEITLVNTFGKPDNDTANVFFSAASFLQYGNNLNVVRVLPKNARNAAEINDGVTYITITTPGAGYVHAPTLTFSVGSATATAAVSNGEIIAATVTAPGSGLSIDTPPTITVTPNGGDSITTTAVLTPRVGVQIQNNVDYTFNYASGTEGVGQFAAKYAGDLGNGLQVFICDDPSQFATWQYRGQFTGAPGTSDYVSALGGTGDELHIVVVDTVGIITGTPGDVIEKFGFVSKASDAKDRQGASIYYPQVLTNKSGWVRWMNFPTTTFNWGSTSRNTTFDGYYVNGAAAYLNVLASNAGIRYASKVPGTGGNAVTINYTNPAADGALSVGVSGTAITVTLGYATGAIDSTAAQVLAAVKAYPAAAALVSAELVSGGNGADLVTAVGTTHLANGINGPGDKASLSVFTTDKGIAYTAVNYGANGDLITVTYVDPGGVSATLGVTVTGTAISVSLGRATSAINTTAGGLQTLLASTPAVTALVNAVLIGAGTTLLTAFSTAPLAGGFDPATYSVLLEGGQSASDEVQDGDIINGYDQFLDETFQFALLITAGHSANVVQYCISNISEYRADNVTFVSPQMSSVVNNLGNESVAIVNDRNVYGSSSYAFMDGNWLQFYDKYNDLYRWIPANGSVAGLCVRTDYTRDPWFSPAGLNRGNIKNVTGLAWNPRQAYRDVLYQAGVNPIVSFPGQGAVLFGDKTMQVKPSAFDRINVRRLFIVIEQAISKAAKYVLFEFNDDVTRTQFRGLIDPFLRDIQGRRGLYAYKVVCDLTNNTPQMIDSNEFQGDIYLQPAKSINFIQLNFIATRTGVDFNTIVGQFGY